MEIYRVENNKTMECAEDVADYITKNADISYYDDMIDDTCGFIEIFGNYYLASNVLKSIDEALYEKTIIDYQGYVYDIILSQIELMEVGDAEVFYDFLVEKLDEE